jgi:hypothetical protein
MGKSITQQQPILHHAFLMLVLDGSERLASRRGRFTPREIAHGSCTTGGRVGPTTALSVLEKRKNLAPAWIASLSKVVHLVSWTLPYTR